jgi:predicted dehydrogenase
MAEQDASEHPEQSAANGVKVSTKRVALIGCGFFADNHLHAWSELADVDIVGVCDLVPEKAEKAAEKFGVTEWYTDAQKND